MENNPITGYSHKGNTPSCLVASSLGCDRYALDFGYAEDSEDRTGWRAFTPGRKIPGLWSGDAVSDLAVEHNLPVAWQ